MHQEVLPVKYPFTKECNSDYIRVKSFKESYRNYFFNEERDCSEEDACDLLLYASLSLVLRFRNGWDVVYRVNEEEKDVEVFIIPLGTWTKESGTLFVRDINRVILGENYEEN